MIASVILAHPTAGSLNHAVAGTAVRALTDAGARVHFHDLYAEDFDPRLRAEEVETTAFADALAAGHAAEIVEADRIVVIHPSWFFHVPAILKGWVDRVLREGIAFGWDGRAVVGRLRAERALIITTANASREHEVTTLGDPLTMFWGDCVFRPAGVARVERMVLSPVRGSTPERRAAWLEEVRRRVIQEGETGQGYVARRAGL